MNLKAATALANWLQLEDPQTFARLLAAARSRKVGALADSLQPVDVTATYETAPAASDSSGGGFFSTLASDVSGAGSDIWSGLSSAASSVGSFISSPLGVQTVSNLAGDYLKAQQTQAQAQVLQTQLARAQAGQAPAAISYAPGPNGQLVPVYTGSTLPPTLATALANGQLQPVTAQNGLPGYAMTPALAASLGPSALTTYLPYIAIGGGLLLLFALSPRRATP